MQQEKKIIGEGYVLEYEVYAAERRIIFAVNPDRKAKNRFMTCFYRHNDIVGEYYDVLVSDDYIEMMKDFAERIKTDVETLEAERKTLGLADTSCLEKEHLLCTGRDIDIHNQIVAIYPRYLLDGCQDIAHQLYYVTGGFGANANSRGNACFCYNLYTGKETRIERPEVFGIVRPECVPDFAKETLNKIKEKEKEKRNSAR